MKKLLLAAVTTTMLTTSPAVAAAENLFYLKANLGASHLQSQTDSATKLELKSNNDIFFGVGLGYHLMDNVRFDLMFDHFINPELKKTGSVAGSTSDVTAKHKGEINSLLFNGYIDLFDISIVKVFAGAGAGLAQIREDIVRTENVSANNFSRSTKKSNNFAYALHLGISSEFSIGISAEIGYSWRDFGKTKPTKYNTTDIGNTNYKGHHFVAGVRFDI